MSDLFDTAPEPESDALAQDLPETVDALAAADEPNANVASSEKARAERAEADAVADEHAAEVEAAKVQPEVDLVDPLDELVKVKISDEFAVEDNVRVSVGDLSVDLPSDGSEVEVTERDARLLAESPAVVRVEVAE